MIEVPRSLVLADVSIRLLYRNYDTMSPRCSTYLPKSKKASEAVSLPPTETVTEEDKSEKVKISIRRVLNVISVYVTRRNETYYNYICLLSTIIELPSLSTVTFMS